MWVFSLTLTHVPITALATPAQVCVSLAYGGMHYAIVDAASVGLRLEASRAREICRLGEMIKIATREQHPVTHPELDYTGPDILVFREASAEEEPAVAGARLGAGTIVPALGGGAAADAQARGFVEAAGGMQAREPHRVLPPVRARNAVVMSNGELDWTRPETWTGMIDRREAAEDELSCPKIVVGGWVEGGWGGSM